MDWIPQIFRSLLDVLHQRIAMRWLAAKRLKDHHLERAGEQIACIAFRHRPVHYRHRLNKYKMDCQGSGKRKRDLFEAGDLLFVAAGAEHQIEAFTDLAVWVVFCGVEGGEVAA